MSELYSHKTSIIYNRCLKPINDGCPKYQNNTSNRAHIPRTEIHFTVQSAFTLSVGRQEGHAACKMLGVGLFVVTM